MACRSLEKGESALKKLEGQQQPGSVLLQQLDITSKDSVTAAVEAIEKRFGRVDILISNAGIIVPDPKDLLDHLWRTFETNTFAQALMTEAFLPLLKASQASTPRLIYVSSDWILLAACNEEEFDRTEGLKHVKVYVFNPGYTVSNLSGTGEKGVEERKQRGAGRPEDSAIALVNTATGRRDQDQERGMVNKEGWFPW
jgi:short-subunit dehydrogenase